MLGVEGEGVVRREGGGDGVRPLRRVLDRPWEDFKSSNSFSALEGPTVKERH